MTDIHTHKVTVQSNSEALKESWQWLLKQFESMDYSDHDSFAVHLALEEAFYNAISHGHKMNIEKKVDIEFNVSPEKVDIYLTDSGPGFDPNTIPDCRLPENLYKTEGRGIFLMKAYMDLVEYNKSGNCVHMVRHRNSSKGVTAKNN